MQQLTLFGMRPIRLLIACLAVVIFQTGVASAYPPHTWIPQTTASTDPAPRTLAPMSFDTHNSKMLMFGGHCAFSLCSSDMWTWAKTLGWAPLTTTGGPSFCPSAEMVYRSAPPRRTVLVCGYDGAPGNIVVWEFDGGSNTWSSTSPSTRPSGRQDYALTYDSVDGVVVLFGGRSNTGSVLNDTWTWDGSNWTLHSPANPPAPRYGAAFAYDQASGESVIVGGQGPGGTSHIDTWAYKNSTWTLRSAAGPLPPRWRARAAYDPVHRQVVLHGGVNLATNAVLADTWAWDGSPLSPGWVQHPTAGPARYGHSMAYDPRTDHTVVFGGAQLPGGPTGDTWVYGLP